MTPNGQAERLISKFGINESIKMCDYFIEGNLDKAQSYWFEVKQIITTNK